jgi:hypothetical protein
VKSDFLDLISAVMPRSTADRCFKESSGVDPDFFPEGDRAGEQEESSSMLFPLVRVTRTTKVQLPRLQNRIIFAHHATIHSLNI